MEQIFNIVRRVLGDGCFDVGEPREEEQHDSEPPETGHRWV